MTRFKTLLAVSILLLSAAALAQKERGAVEVVRETTNI